MTKFQVLRRVLYSIAFGEIFLFIWLDIKYSILIVISILSVFSIRMYFTSRNMKWISFRNQIREILIANSIINEGNGEYLESSSNLIDEIIMPTKIREDFIKTIRKIGIDSIIVLIFLMKNFPNYISVQTLLSTLYIPRSTLYRNLNKLDELDFINSKNILSDPGKTYYSITELGESIIVELYEIIDDNYLLNIK